MSTTLAESTAAYAEALAELFESTAAFRRDKAEQFPEDGRNLRSSMALEAAAAYLRTIDPVENRGLRLFAEFEDHLEAWRDPRDPAEIVSMSSHVASRFCFDNATAAPAPRDFDRLIASVFTETLEGWRDSLEDGIDTPPRALVAFFDEHGVPLWESDDEEDDDAR